ncbi:Uncharacterized protein SCF082_LOCUS41187 [Durusdinium trenchii]|uniref:Uncharacterized protein n=1 Tax=Durusdinium trenchii TaxID=1381693 RepID=A0ABP0QJ05_9DINO
MAGEPQDDSPSWVDELEAESHFLKARLAECEEDLLAGFGFADDASKRKGLVALMELGVTQVERWDSERLRRAAQARLQSNRKRGGGPGAEEGDEGRASLEKLSEYFQSADLAVTEQLGKATARLTAVTRQEELLRAELAAAQERRATHEESAREEQLRHDSIINDQVQEIKLELYQLDHEAAELKRQSSQKFQRHAAGKKLLQRIFKFMLPSGFAREILWRWRFLLPP